MLEKNDVKYFKKDSNEFVQNGVGLVRVESLAIVGDPYNKGRVGRIVAVKEVKRMNSNNPICPGFQFCLSIPQDKINAREYTWKRDEVKQIPLKRRSIASKLAITDQPLN